MLLLFMISHVIQWFSASLTGYMHIKAGAVELQEFLLLEQATSVLQCERRVQMPP